MSAAAAIGIAYVLTVVVLTAAFVRIMRRMPEQDRVEAARARVGLTPPAVDNRPGLDADAQDACELIWSMPAYGDADLEAGEARLRAAIRDEQSEAGDA